MADFTKPILGAAVGLGATALLAKNARAAQSYLSPGKKRKKKRGNGLGMTRLGVDTIISTSLLGASAKVVNDL